MTNEAIIHARVSTPGQAEDGLGLEAQLEACRKVAAEHGFDVADEIVEQGSGAYLEREGLDRVRALVRSKQVDALITYDLDRLSRDEIGTVIVLSEAWEAGVTVYTRTGPVDSTREGNLISYVKAYAAALEKDKIRQRTMDGKRMAARAGVLPVGSGAGLYGYDYTPRDRASRKPQARTVNQSESTVVKRMFGMAIAGLGINTIAVQLNREGVRGKTGAPWHPWTIKNLLRNPAYAGHTRYGAAVTKLGPGGHVSKSRRDEAEVIMIEGFTPPIIDAATFERVQAHLDRPRRSGHPHEPYMLSGMLRCADCGTGFVGQKLRRRWRYYTCRGTSATATRPRICSAKSARMEALDERVWVAVSRSMRDPAFLVERVLAQQAMPTPQPADPGAPARARIKALANEEKSLVAALRAAPSAAETIEKELEKIAGERRSLERTLKATEAAQCPLDDVQIDPDAIKRFAQALGPRLRAMGVEERHELLSLLGFEATVAASGDVKASIAVPSAPDESYSPLHEHRHDDVDVVVVVYRADDTGTR